MSVLELRSKNWVVPYLRELMAWFDETATKAALKPFAETVEDERLDRWLSHALRTRGLLSGAPKVVYPRSPASKLDRGEWLFLNVLSHQVEMLLELRILAGHGISSVGDQIQLLMVLAADCGKFRAAERLYELSLEEWGGPDDPRREKLAKGMGPSIRDLGRALKASSLHAADHPLLGLPFHHVLDYAATCELMEIAHMQFGKGGRLDETAIVPLRARGHMQRLHLIEAVLALANADGTITRVERRLLEDIIELARLTSDEARMVWAELDDPPDATRLGRLITDKRTRRFLFEQISLHGHLDGELLPEEQDFIEELATSFGISLDERLAYEAEALAYLEDNPALVESFSLSGVVRRFRVHLSQRVESAVKVNLGRLVTEIRETGELAQLLVKRTQGQLSDDEEARMRQQIVDICKTVPALAVFAAPGGTILLPIIMKLLPFDLMPSAFTEKDEAL